MEIFRSWRVVLLACAAGAVSLLVFGFDWLNYSMSENGPSYYAFSDYVEYRNAPALPIGIGYALLTASLVVGAALVGRGWRGALALAALGSIALPLVVAAALPRAEYGKDPVFYTAVNYEDPTNGRPVVCFGYGVQGIEADPTTGDDRDLCLQLPDTSTAPRLITGRPLALDEDTPPRLAEALNETGIRPRDPVGNLEELAGIEIVRATWGIPESKPTPVELTDDRETQLQLERLAGRLDACSAAEGYAACTDIDALARAGLVIGTGPGRLEISVDGNRGYAITGQSISGTTFTLNERRREPTGRDCTPSGGHGCSPRAGW